MRVDSEYSDLPHIYYCYFVVAPFETEVFDIPPRFHYSSYHAASFATKKMVKHFTCVIGL